MPDPRQIDGIARLSSRICQSAEYPCALVCRETEMWPSDARGHGRGAGQRQEMQRFAARDGEFDMEAERALIAECRQIDRHGQGLEAGDLTTSGAKVLTPDFKALQ